MSGCCKRWFRPAPSMDLPPCSGATASRASRSNDAGRETVASREPGRPAAKPDHSRSSALSLIGKGYYIWQLWNCERGDAQAITARAKQAGLTHLLIKIADGTRSYNVDATRGVDLVPPVLRACKEAGIEVWGWHYVRGDNPIGEAQFAVQRSRQLGIDGYVIDAEAEYQTLGKTNAATRFMRELRAGLPNLPIALSSYRFPDRHRQLPWSAFLEGCDYSMPQVYYEQAHNPTQQLEMCVDQYMALRPARPGIPTAPAYGRGDWRPTAPEAVLFLAKAKELGLSAANVWSWDVASRPAYRDLAEGG